MNRLTPDVVARLFSYGDKGGGEGACWPWLGGKVDGYGRFNFANGTFIAHRVAYIATIGRDLPSDVEVDHLCRRRDCVNPAHLEAVSVRENQRRGAHGLKTHCPSGHPYSGRNLKLNRGWRVCRECNQRSKERPGAA